MNANELADWIEKSPYSEYHTAIEAAFMLRQQQAEIEALKKACLDEITKRVYADQTTKVMEGYWEEAQEEIERLKVQYGICEDKPMTTFTTQDRQEAQRVPLTKDEIECMFNEHLNTTTHVYSTWPSFYEFARAIERAHGIGE